MYLYAERPAPNFDVPPMESFDEDNEVYVSGYSFDEEDSRQRYGALLDESGLREVADPSTPSATVVLESPPLARVTVAYWRKANQIHKWFVDNCQEGVDECQVSDPISREKLTELRDLCQQVIDKSVLVEGKIANGYSMTSTGGREFHYQDGKIVTNPEVAEKLLPSQGGFFFGGTDYDEWYIDELKNTVEQIDRVLAAPEDTVYRYHSSW
jgi:hypothetical protein